MARDLYAEGVQAQPRDQDPGNMSSVTGGEKEYLLSLQQRSKWKDRRNAKVNDIVLLQDDATSRNQWKMAKVT